MRLYVQVPAAAVSGCAHSTRFFTRREESELNLLRQVASHINNNLLPPATLITEADIYSRAYDQSRASKFCGPNLRDFLYQLAKNVPDAGSLVLAADAFEGDPYLSLDALGAVRARSLLDLLNEYSTQFYGQPLALVSTDFPLETRLKCFWASIGHLTSRFQMPELLSVVADPFASTVIPPTPLAEFPAPVHPEVLFGINEPLGERASYYTTYAEPSLTIRQAHHWLGHPFNFRPELVDGSIGKFEKVTHRTET